MVKTPSPTTLYNSIWQSLKLRHLLVYRDIHQTTHLFLKHLVGIASLLEHLGILRCHQGLLSIILFGVLLPNDKHKLTIWAYKNLRTSGTALSKVYHIPSHCCMCLSSLLGPAASNLLQINVAEEEHCGGCLEPGNSAMKVMRQRHPTIIFSVVLSTLIIWWRKNFAHVWWTNEKK